MATTKATVSVIADDAVGTAQIADNAITNALMADDAVGVAELSATGTASANTVLRGDNTWSAAGLIQTVNTQTGAVATGTTTLPNDDTIPQKTEGDEYMTLAITPTSATNILEIVAVWNGSSTSTGGILTQALFQDATAGALAASWSGVYASGATTQTVLHHRMVAGTTSATTFKIRAGAPAAGTTTFNGLAGVRVYGGVMSSSITIREITS